jgi:hypothetical protein
MKISLCIKIEFWKHNSDLNLKLWLKMGIWKGKFKKEKQWNPAWAQTTPNLAHLSIPPPPRRTTASLWRVEPLCHRPWTCSDLALPSPMLGSHPQCSSSPQISDAQCLCRVNLSQLVQRPGEPDARTARLINAQTWEHLEGGWIGDPVKFKH